MGCGVDKARKPILSGRSEGVGKIEEKIETRLDKDVSLRHQSAQLLIHLLPQTARSFVFCLQMKEEIEVAKSQCFVLFL